MGNDFFGGLAHGLAGLAGMGSLYNPMGKLSGKLSSSISSMNDMVADSTTIAFKETEQEFVELKNLMEDKGNALVASQATTNQMLFNSLQQENLFITLLSICVIIVIFYLMTQKKCC